LAGGVVRDVIALLPGELFSKISDNSVAIVLSYGTACILLAGEAEARKEDYVANPCYTRPWMVIKVETTKLSEKIPRPADRSSFGGGAGAGLA
jgi:hypothetical protein